MIFSLPIADILHSEILLQDDFTTNIRGWEITEDEEEKSFIKDSHYWMENKSESRWMFYHKKLPIKKEDNFIIMAQIDLLNHQGYGQYGLVWGFDKEHKILNRFSVSVESTRLSICRFEKNHRSIFHRFSNQYEKVNKSNNKQFFSIMRIEDYYYFFLHKDKRPMYICHTSQLCMDGLRFGFYLEPGIMIRCDKITVKRLILNKGFTG